MKAYGPRVRWAMTGSSEGLRATSYRSPLHTAVGRSACTGSAKGSNEAICKLVTPFGRASHKVVPAHHSVLTEEATMCIPIVLAICTGLKDTASATAAVLTLAGS